MRDLTILNERTGDTSFEPKGQAEEILSQTFGAFGPIAAFNIYALYEVPENKVVMCLDTWRSLPLYEAFLRFKNFDLYNISGNEDIAYALAAVLDQANAEEEMKSFQTLISGEACTRDSDHHKLIIERRALSALINAIRAAVEYSYFKGTKEQQFFWRQIFSQKGARYSDGLFSGSFSADKGLGVPKIDMIITRLHNSLLSRIVQ